MMAQEDVFTNVQIQLSQTIFKVYAIITLLTALFLAHTIQFVQLTLVTVGEILITTAAYIYVVIVLGILMEIMQLKLARPTAQLDPMLTIIQERGHVLRSVLAIIMPKGLLMLQKKMLTILNLIAMVIILQIDV